MDFHQYMIPFWAGTTMHNESVLMVSDDNGRACAPLLFNPTAILSVRNSALDITYRQGVDWDYEKGNLKLLPESSIPHLTIADLYPSSQKDKWTMPKIGGGYVLFHEGHFFHVHQLAVTYTHAADMWNGPVPQFDNGRLPGSFHKLNNGSPFKVILYGDSISVGANASSYSGVPPFMPVWGQLFADNLKSYYSSSIEFENPSVGGQDSIWGLSNVNALVSDRNPDLVIIAFGMNDGAAGLSPIKFKLNVQGIMDDIKAKNPDVEFVLVATTLANPESYFAGRQADYLKELQSLAGVGVVIVDMTGIHQELLSKKRFIDMTGNNINHPNDFLNRWYAQYVSGFFIKRI